MNEGAFLLQDFYNNLYKNCRGKVAVAKSKNDEPNMIYVGRVIDPVKRQKNLDYYLQFENIKISIATYRSECIGKKITENEIRDVNAIVLKGTLSSHEQKDFDIMRFNTRINVELIIHKKDYLAPTFIVAAEDIYFIYVLNKNRYVEKHNDEARGSTLRFLQYIAEGLCKELNVLFKYEFKTVKPTEMIPIPGSTYAIRKARRNDNTGTMYSEIIYSSIVSILKPLGSQVWDIDELARIAHVPKITKKETKPKRAVKIHIKEHAYKSVEDMLRARLKLIEAVYNSFKFDAYDREQVREIIYLYFNFAYDIVKDKKIAERDTINAFKELFEYQGRDFEERVSNLERFMKLPQDFFAAKKGYSYTDMHLFEKLDLTVEEAAAFGYVKSDRENYMTQYNKARYAAKKAEKEVNGTTRKQKAKRMATKINELLSEGKSNKDIAEILGITARTVRNYIKISNKCEG